MFFSGIADESGKPIETQIRAHKELGWKHIEIRNVNATTLAYAEQKEFDSIRAALDKAGIKVSCFASQIANWSRDIFGPFETDADELRRAIPRMKIMGTPFIRVMSYANKNNVGIPEWRKESIRRLRELATMAEQGGVMLLHENCDGWGGKGPQQSLELLAEVNSPALKLVFDTGNPVWHQQDSWDYYSQVKKQVLYVHIKDANRAADGKVTPCYVGEGQGNARRIIKDLVASGYAGGVSIEPHIAAIVHEGKESSADQLYLTYLEYGRRLMKIVEEAKK